MLPFQPNHSLQDGIQILQTVVANDEPIGSREVSRRLGMDPTRTNRLLKTLAAMGMLLQTGNRKYTSGHGIHVFAAQSLRASGLLNAAIPHLETLHELGYLVSMGVVWRDRVSYLYYRQCASTTSDDSGLHTGLAATGAFPVEQSGIGIAYLAALPDDRLQEEHQGLSELALRRIREAQRQSYAYVCYRESHTLALPVGPEPSEPIAAIGLAGAIASGDIPVLLPRLQMAASQIHHSLRSRTSNALKNT